MKLAKEWDGNLTDLMTEYSFQPELTRKLDGVSNQSFDQPLVNEIVLWKVNRPRCQGSCRLSEMESGVGWGRKVDYRDETLLSRT